MSITLTVKVGSGFYVGDSRFTVESAQVDSGSYTCLVSYDNKHKWEVGQKDWVSAFPGMQLKLSTKRPDAFGGVRVMVEAPDYRVLRDVLYEQNRSSANG